MADKAKKPKKAKKADAQPKCHEVHSDPAARNAAEQPLPKGMAQKPVAQKSPAQWAYERTVLYLKKFEEGLTEGEEIAMGFAGTDAGVLKIEGMGYFDPDVVTFYGSDAKGGKMQLVQHVSQLSVVFRAVPKAVEAEPPNRIGFKLIADLEEEEAEA